MTVLFAAIRTIAFATVFVWLWAMVGLWARQFDAMFGGPLPSWTWPLGVAVLMAGVPLALTCMALFAIRGKGTPAPFDPPSRVCRLRPVPGRPQSDVRRRVADDRWLRADRAIEQRARFFVRLAPAHSSVRDPLRGAGADREIRRHLRSVPLDGAAMDPQREIGELMNW